MTAADARLVAGRYRVERPLGQGGMGRVWLAEDLVLGREVAVKEIVLPPDLTERERDALRERTLREARAAARLTHRNVAGVYDVFEVDGQPWIVMEHVPSRSLQQVMDAEGPLEPGRVAEIGLLVLAALRAAHRAGVRHRDVKPSNVLLGVDGRVVLTDFGIATIEGDGSTTTSGLVLGSPQFMAPERALSGESLPASDLWSLGATLYAAVEGRPPYQRPSAVGTLMALVAEDPEPPHRAGVLRPVLDGLLRKDPGERIDGAEARRRLRVAAATTARPEPLAVPSDPVPSDPVPPISTPPISTPPISAPPISAPPISAPPGSVPPISAPRRRSRRWIMVLAATLLAVVIATVVVIALATSDAGNRSTATRPSAGPLSQPPPGASAGATPSTAASTAASTGPSTGSAGATPAGTDPVTRGSRPALPSGWTDYHDRTGFSVYVPAGWTKSRKGSMVYFRGAGRVLGIDQTTQPNMNPVADWRGKADYRVARGDFPGYHEIHIKPVTYFVKAADWEFTFDGSSGRQHVNNRGVVVNGHQAYGFYWQTPDSSWASAYPDLQLVFRSFRPR